SQRAIERIGATREGVLRKQMILWDGFIRDSVYYSVIDSEWPRVKHHLARLLQSDAQPAREIGREGAHLIAAPRATSGHRRWPMAACMAAVMSGCFVAIRRSYE